MRIIVCVKQVLDPATVKVSRSREEFDLRQAARKTNPADRYALEAALRLREALGGEVIALTVGDAGAEDAVREAIAMGVDHGALVAGPELAGLGGAALTRAVLAAVERIGSPDLVLTGQMSPVDGTGSLPARLAAALNCTLALDAVCLEPAADGSVQAVVVDNGQPCAVPLPSPSVAAIAPGADRPRYPGAARIANAYQADMVDVWSADDLGLDAGALAPDVEPGGLVLGPERTLGQTIGGSLQEAAGAVVEILKAKRIA